VGLELDLAQALPSVRADGHELVQVLVNLLGNAHHVLSRASGPRRVFVRTWSEQGRVYCRILDTGPGVEAEVRHRLFSPFFSTKEAGVGLGLTVSRNLVRGAGGELSLDETGAGASFTLWLPGIEKAAENAGADSMEGSVEKPMPLKGVSILIADDEDAIRGVLERFFQRDGATVVGVSGGVDALDVIRRRTVDVIVLDVRMPDKDGAEVYRELRKERPELAGRVIFLSGDVTRVTEELDVPQSRVLVKPVELGDLKRAVMDTVAGMRSTFSLR
jgi:two-component system NtrC family sensor kinase